MRRTHVSALPQGFALCKQYFVIRFGLQKSRRLLAATFAEHLALVCRSLNDMCWARITQMLFNRGMSVVAVRHQSNFNEDNKQHKSILKLPNQQMF